MCVCVCVYLVYTHPHTQTQLKALRVPDLPKMPPMPGMPFPGGPDEKGDVPPNYSDPEAHGLVDMGE